MEPRMEKCPVTACLPAEAYAGNGLNNQPTVASAADTADAMETARTVGLRYLTDNQAGIRRRRAGKGFTYRGPGEGKIQNPDELERIRSLRIPPAWKDVWISPVPESHLQATGRDAKGRKQYIYHPRWRALRDQNKFSRMVAFGMALPRIRERTERDLGLPGLARNKVLATVVRLLEKTLIRVGNKEYVRENQSYGLTTLERSHLDVKGARVRFSFRGKSGKEHTIEVNDRRLARIVKQCREIPGHELFRYVDDDGQYRAIDSSDVNAYLREIGGECFTAKDFRTWGGTVHAAAALKETGPFKSEREAKKNIVETVKRVSHHLGNKPSICRTYYIHPAVIETYMDGSLLRILDEWEREGARNSGPHQLKPVEKAVLDILRRKMANGQVCIGAGVEVEEMEEMPEARIVK